MTTDFDTDVNFDSSEILEFGTPQADVKPTLICVGNVTAVGEAGISKSGKNVVIPISIEPVDAGRKTKVYFCFRPEWLTPGFKPHELENIDKGAHWTYKKNIADAEGLSLLRGLSGSKAAFSRLSNILLHLPKGDNGSAMEDVADALREFFLNNVDDSKKPVRVGYVLVQRSTKTDEVEVGQDGKEHAVYLREPYYDLKEYWDVTGDNIKRKLRQADNSEGRTKMTFSGLPF